MCQLTFNKHIYMICCASPSGILARSHFCSTLTPDDGEPLQWCWWWCWSSLGHAGGPQCWWAPAPAGCRPRCWARALSPPSQSLTPITRESHACDSQPLLQLATKSSHCKELRTTTAQHEEHCSDHCFKNSPSSIVWKLSRGPADTREGNNSNKNRQWWLS